MTMQGIEVWILMDESGDIGVGTSADDAKERYINDIGDVPAVTRTVCLKLQVPLPVPCVLEGTVPAGEATESVLSIH